MMHHIMTLRVRHSETGFYGIAQHSHYYTWLELALQDYLQELGWSLAELAAQGMRFPVVDSQCSFRRPVFFDDNLSIHLRLTGLGNARAVFAFEIFRLRDGAEVARARNTYAFVDENMRPLRLERTVPALYNSLLAALADGEKDKEE